MVTIKDLTDEIADKAKLTKVEAQDLINLVLDTIKDNLHRKQEVRLHNFGIFKIKARSGSINGKKYSAMFVRFKPFKDLSNRVK